MKQRPPSYIVARTFALDGDTYYVGNRVQQTVLSRLPAWRLEELEREGCIRSPERSA